MSSLRALAQKAKYRLRAISCESNKTVEEIESVAEKTYGEACLSARIQYAIIASQKRVQDDPLYNKVKKMLSKNLDVTNPLAQIIEHNIYDDLDDFQKEKYIYKLSKRYVEMRQQIIKELAQEGIIA